MQQAGSAESAQQGVGDAAARVAAAPWLGVGVLYTPALNDFVRSELDLLDFVEVIPDMAQTDHGAGRQPRFTELESWTDLFDWLAPRRPLLAHNIGLSVGSSDVFDPGYVGQLVRWHQRYPFRWHSDHLSFSQITGHDGDAHNVGVALPIPYDEDVLTMVAERVVFVQQALQAPVLLENNVYYVQLPEQDMDEATFLNRLAARTGCGLLLDLHNVYANARNHAFSASAFVDRLDLHHVIEVHVAGGNELAGMYTDSHAGPCPEPVWELLAHIAPRAPNLRAVTFEFHDSYFPLLGADGVRQQLARARDAWACPSR